MDSLKESTCLKLSCPEKWNEIGLMGTHSVFHLKKHLKKCHFENRPSSNCVSRWKLYSAAAGTLFNLFSHSLIFFENIWNMHLQCNRLRISSGLRTSRDVSGRGFHVGFLWCHDKALFQRTSEGGVVCSRSGMDRAIVSIDLNRLAPHLTARTKLLKK